MTEKKTGADPGICAFVRKVGGCLSTNASVPKQRRSKQSCGVGEHEGCGGDEIPVKELIF